MNLGERATRGAALTMTVQGARFLVQLIGLVILGRLLTPTDFGLLAMVTAITGFGDVVRDFGLMTAAVQAKHLSDRQQNNLFWINTAIGALLVILCFGAATFVSNIYNEPRLSAIVSIIAFTFLFNGIQTQFQARLTRSLRFGALSLSDLGAQTAGLAAAVLSALNGLGYWSLVIQLVVQSFALLVLRAFATGWIPGLPSQNANMGPLLKFGRNLMGTQTLVYFSSSIDSVVMGTRFGADQLGLYGRAFQILMMPLNQVLSPLSGVALPVLSRIKHDKLQYEAYTHRALILLSYPTVGAFAGLAASAAWLIPAVFGSQWQNSAFYFQILAIGGCFQVVGYVAYWIFLSSGLTASHFRYSLISRSFLILSILVGSLFGPYWIALGYTIGIAAMWPISLMWLGRAASMNSRPLLLSGLKIISISLVCGLAGWGVTHGLASQNSWLNIALSLLTTFTLLFLAIFFMPFCKQDKNHLIQALNVIKRKSSSKPMEEI